MIFDRFGYKKSFRKFFFPGAEADLHLNYEIVLIVTQSFSGLHESLVPTVTQSHTGLHFPDIADRTALAVRPDVVNAKYHVITNATYNRDPLPAKFKHVTNIETCTLLCCDYSTLWEALHANKVEIGARCSDKNVKILGRYQWIG